jgi:thiol:disulfide interchange protein DsbD
MQAFSMMRKPSGCSLLFQHPICFAIFFLLPCLCAADTVVTTENARAQLISETTAIQPDKAFWVALRLQVRDGWHTYWRNPGDTGMITSLEWSLPEGFKAGPIHWPYPEQIPVGGGMMNYGYHGEVLLLARITPPADMADSREATLAAHARWLVCEEICIPEDADLSLTLPVTYVTPKHDERWSEAFAEARQALPKSSPWAVAFETTPDTLTLRVATPELQPDQIEQVYFFPFADGVIEYGSPQTLTVEDAGFTLTTARNPTNDEPLEQVRGVIVIDERTDDESRAQAWRIDASPATPASAVLGDAVDGQTISSIALLREMLFAFLGGIILNLMPCVFPVLSIKALSFIDKSRKDPWEVRRHGVVFTAGVLVCFAVIAGVLIGLRGAGAQIGWGFQLQSPVFITVLAYLMFAVGLSLSGMFTLGNNLMGIGNGLAARPDYLGSFATGALTTIVATPCTAPFMGAALGYALTQPWQVGLMVFMALGFGLAFPYFTFSFFPALFRLLPRPGAWMERVKEFLAFPMYATAAWLLWVLALQTGPNGVVTALAGIILIAFAGWLFQSTRMAKSLWRSAGHVSAIGVVAVVIGMLWLPSFDSKYSVSSPEQQSGQGPRWEPFSATRLRELRADGRPVFVNFTAAWCITCLANERVALSSHRLATAFARKGIVYLKGDWTNRNPEITRVLSSFGRSGVPLYIYYPPGDDGDPVILPQILTESIVLTAMNLSTDRESVLEQAFF